MPVSVPSVTIPPRASSPSPSARSTPPVPSVVPNEPNSEIVERSLSDRALIVPSTFTWPASAVRLTDRAVIVSPAPRLRSPVATRTLRRPENPPLSSAPFSWVKFESEPAKRSTEAPTPPRKTESSRARPFD